MQVMPMAKDGVSQQCAISNFYFYFIFLWQHWVMLRWWSITAKVLPPGAQNPAPAPSTTLPASKARHLPPIQVKLYLTSLLYRWNYISPHNFKTSWHQNLLVGGMALIKRVNFSYTNAKCHTFVNLMDFAFIPKRQILNFNTSQKTWY